MISLSPLDMNPDEVNKILSKYYYSLKNQSSFSSAQKLYQIVNANRDKKNGYHKIRRWLNSQDNYILFSRTLVILLDDYMCTQRGIHNLHEADLFEIGNIAKENDFYRYILVVLDVFSNYLWLHPLKTKTGEGVSTALRTNYQHVKPEKLRTDKDQCLLSKKESDCLRSWELGTLLRRMRLF